MSTYAIAAPAMPSCGMPPSPSTSEPESGTWITAAPIRPSAGTSMLPLPRSTLESVLASQTVIAPAKMMFE